MAVVALGAGCGGESEADDTDARVDVSTSADAEDSEGTGAPNVSLAELVERDPEPLEGPLDGAEEGACGTMEGGDDNLDPEFDQELIDLGATNSSSTFCSNAVEGLEAVEFSSSSKASEIVEDGMFLKALAGDAIADSGPEVHGDIRCQSLIGDGDRVAVCVVAVSNIVLVAVGDEGFDPNTVIEDGIAPMVAWVG